MKISISALLEALRIWFYIKTSPVHPKGSGCIWDKEKPANVVFTGFSFGAGSRTRTGDLRITNALLYQLSHTSIDVI